MKLRNKKTGDIWEFDEGFSMKASQETAERAGARSGVLTCFADSLAELNEEWEDCEEPKENEFFKFTPGLLDNRFVVFILDEKASRKDAKKLMAKLKAWKRLRDKGFKFKGIRTVGKVIDFDIPRKYYCDDNEKSLELFNDLNLLFGGEE